MISGIKKSCKKRSRPRGVNSVRVHTASAYGPTEYMNNLNFVLNIATTKTAPQCGMLLNRFEEPDSKIIHLSVPSVGLYNNQSNECEEQTKDDLKRVGFYGSYVILYNERIDEAGNVTNTTKRTYTNKKGYFTVYEMIKNIVKFESVERPKSLWFGGVDCHHVFFEGIHSNSALNGSYCVSWGS